MHFDDLSCFADYMSKYQLAPYRVVSLDCWGTLLKANDQIWQFLAEFVKTEFKPAQSADEIRETFKTVNQMIDRDSNNSGIEPGQSWRISSVLTELNINADESKIYKTIEYIDNLLGDVDTNIIVLCDDIDSVLGEMSPNLIMISNSGLISGRQTRLILQKLNIYHYFTKLYMSDELKISKPSLRLYDFVFSDLINSKLVSCKKDLVHVGDNYRVDYLAALSSGVQAAYITKHRSTCIYNSLVEFYYEKNEMRSSNTDVIDPKFYSQFKYGSIKSLNHFAFLMLNFIDEHFNDLVYSAKPPILVQIKQKTTSADDLLRREIYKHINDKRANLNLEQCPIVNIKYLEPENFESKSGVPAYARNDALLDIVAARADICKFEDVIFLDDIVVSRSMGDSIYRTFINAGAKKVWIFSVGSCREDSLVANGRLIESDLNKYSIKSLSDINSLIIAGQSFVPTRRYYKLLIRHNLHQIDQHVKLISDTTIKKIFDDLNSDLTLTLNQRNKVNSILKLLDRERHERNA